MDKIGWYNKYGKDSNINKYFLFRDDRYIIYENIDIEDKYKICRGYKGTKYLVTDKGNIYHYIPQYNMIKLLNTWNCRGYKKIGVRLENGKYVQFFVHRIVAFLFIPNPKNKEEVNHKNRDKSDNKVENLEWVTRSENEHHKWKSQGGMSEKGKQNIREALKGSKSYRAKKVECVETGEIWGTAKEASFANGYSMNRVSQVCKTGQAIKGKHFRYV